MVVRLCERFHCLPSQLMQEDAEFLRLILIDHMGTPQSQQPPDAEGMEDIYG
jgi:hypothetical protein